MGIFSSLKDIFGKKEEKVVESKSEPKTPMIRRNSDFMKNTNGQRAVVTHGGRYTDGMNVVKRTNESAKNVTIRENGNVKRVGGNVRPLTLAEKLGNGAKEKKSSPSKVRTRTASERVKVADDDKDGRARTAKRPALSPIIHDVRKSRQTIRGRDGKMHEPMKAGKSPMKPIYIFGSAILKATVKGKTEDEKNRPSHYDVMFGREKVEDVRKSNANADHAKVIAATRRNQMKYRLAFHGKPSLLVEFEYRGAKCYVLSLDVCMCAAVFIDKVHDISPEAVERCASEIRHPLCNAELALFDDAGIRPTQEMMTLCNNIGWVYNNPKMDEIGMDVFDIEGHEKGKYRGLKHNTTESVMEDVMKTIDTILDTERK